MFKNLNLHATSSIQWVTGFFSSKVEERDSGLSDRKKEENLMLSIVTLPFKIVSFSVNLVLSILGFAFQLTGIPFLFRLIFKSSENKSQDNVESEDDGNKPSAGL